MKKLLFFILFIGLIQPAFAQTAKAIDPKLQKLKDNLDAAQNDTARMTAYKNISIYFQDVQPQYDSALVYGLKAGQIADNYPNEPTIVKIWNTIGNAYGKLHQTTLNKTNQNYYFEQGEKYYKKAINGCQTFGNKDVLKKAWYNMNALYGKSPNKYLYFKNSFEFIAYFEQQKQYNKLDSLLLRKTYISLIAKLDYDMDSKTREKYFQSAQNIIKKGDGESYEHLCVLLFEKHSLLWGKADEQKLNEEYNTLKKTLELPYSLSQLELYLAQFYFTIHEYEKSFQLSANYYPKNVSDIYYKLAFENINYINMGRCAYELHRNTEAIRYLNKALSSLVRVEHVTDMRDEKYTALLYLSKAYKKVGNYKKALDCTEQADVLYKEMHDISTQALMAENDVQVEQIKQDKKVQEAQTQILLKEQETQLEKRQKYMFALFALVALLSTGWAFYNFLKTRRQNAIISQQAVALQESNQVKDKIFALLGHDLRAPINRLVMRMNDSGSGQLPDIRHELKNMYDILNNVLYWASMQLKKITPVNRPIELKYLVSSVAEEYQFDLTEKNITFLNAIDKTTEVKTDENYLKIILRNLISNAIKFTNPNGFIKIDCSIKNSIAEIILKDTGIGVPPEKLKTIFNL